MSTGKYSPLYPHAREPGYESFTFNCYGEVPPPRDADDEYVTRLHYDSYDSEGFDSYGYSCFDSDGVYVDIGDGIDRYGNTEMDYMNNSRLYYDGPHFLQTEFIRNRD